MQTPPSGHYASPPDDIYAGDAWAGGSGIALGLLGCACGLPALNNNPAVKDVPAAVPFALAVLFGCGALSIWIDWQVIKGKRWAMIVSLVLIGFGLIGLLMRASGGASPQTANVTSPLQILRMLILVFYLPLRLGRAFGPELN